MNSGEQLCVACGLCCDGTLFDNVTLEAGDDLAKMKALGQPMEASTVLKGVYFFRQPCAALCADRTCRIYADRPVQCRTFDCGVLKDAQAGQITFVEALRWVKQARRHADRARRLLRKLGDTEDHRSLHGRFKRMRRRLGGGVEDAAAAANFAELGLAMHRLDLLTHEKFHTQADESRV